MNNVENNFCIRDMFGSHTFYAILVPNLIALYLILTNDLGFLYVFLLFYIQLFIELVLLSLSPLLTRKEDIKDIYKCEYPPIVLARNLFASMFMFIFFLSVIIYAFLFHMTGIGNVEKVMEAFNNETLWIAVGSYIVIRVISYIQNVYQYYRGVQKQIEEGTSFIVKLLTVIFLGVPGVHVFIGIIFIAQIVGVLDVFIDNYYESVAIIIVMLLETCIEELMVYGQKKDTYN